MFPRSPAKAAPANERNCAYTAWYSASEASDSPAAAALMSSVIGWLGTDGPLGTSQSSKAGRFELRVGRRWGNAERSGSAREPSTPRSMVSVPSICEKSQSSQPMASDPPPASWTAKLRRCSRRPSSLHRCRPSPTGRWPTRSARRTGRASSGSRTLRKSSVRTSSRARRSAADRERRANDRGPLRSRPKGPAGTPMQDTEAAARTKTPAFRGPAGTAAVGAEVIGQETPS